MGDGSAARDISGDLLNFSMYALQGLVPTLPVDLIIVFNKSDNTRSTEELTDEWRKTHDAVCITRC